MLLNDHSKEKDAPMRRVAPFRKSKSLGQLQGQQYGHHHLGMASEEVFQLPQLHQLRPQIACWDSKAMLRCVGIHDPPCPPFLFGWVKWPMAPKNSTLEKHSVAQHKYSNRNRTSSTLKAPRTAPSQQHLGHMHLAHYWPCHTAHPSVTTIFAPQVPLYEKKPCRWKAMGTRISSWKRKLEC